MKDQSSAWAKVGRYASGFEAEIARAVLEGGGFDARVMANDIVGIFGPNFMGSSSRGAFVLVPGPQAAAAERYLAQRARDLSAEAEASKDESEREGDGTDDHGIPR